MANDGVQELCFTVSVEGGDKAKTQHFGLVPGAVVKIGRASSNDIVLSQRGISSHHAELRVIKEAGSGALNLFARDVSMNGTGIKRFSDVPPVSIEKGYDEMLPDGALLFFPLRLKDPTAERAWLRVQYEEPTSAPSLPNDDAPAKASLEAPPPAAPGQRCRVDPYGSLSGEVDDDSTALDKYINVMPRRATTRPGPPEPAPASTQQQAGRAFAKKASALPPSFQSSCVPSLPPGTREAVRPPPAWSPLASTQTAPPATSNPGARAKSGYSKSAPPAPIGQGYQARPKFSYPAPPPRPEEDEPRRHDRRSNRSPSPRNARRDRRRDVSRSRSNHRKSSAAPRTGGLSPPPGTWNGPGVGNSTRSQGPTNREVAERYRSNSRGGRRRRRG